MDTFKTLRTDFFPGIRPLFTHGTHSCMSLVGSDWPLGPLTSQREARFPSSP